MFNRLMILAGLSLAAFCSPVCGQGAEITKQVGVVESLQPNELAPAKEADSAPVVREIRADLASALIGVDVADKHKNNRAIQQLLKSLNTGANKQQKMKEALSPVMQARLDAFMGRYTDFISRVHAPHAMYTLGYELMLVLGNPVEGEAASITALRPLLLEGLEALRAGAWGPMFETVSVNKRNEICLLLGTVFAGAVTTASPAPNLVNKIPKPYTFAALASLDLALATAEVEIRKINLEQPSFDYFKQYLDAIVRQDAHELAKVAIVYLEEEHLAVMRELFGLQEDLFALFEQSTVRATMATSLSQEDSDDKSTHIEQVLKKINALLGEKDLQRLYGSNPYFYWLMQLKRQEGSCDAYQAIKQRFSTKDINHDYYTFFKLFAHAYTFAHNFLDIYHEEIGTINNGTMQRYTEEISRINNLFPGAITDEQRAAKAAMLAAADVAKDANSLGLAVNWMPTLLNYAFTGTFAANYFFNAQAIARNSSYYDILLNEGAIADERAATKALVSDYIAMLVAGPVLMGSPLGYSMKATHVGSKFERMAASFGYYHVFYNGLFNRNGIFNAANQPDAGVKSLWPAEFKIFRNAMFDSLSEGANFLSFVAEGTCYQYLDKDIMADIDDITLGIVNPGALRYVLKAFMPMLLLSPALSLLRGGMVATDQQRDAHLFAGRNVAALTWEGAIRGQYGLDSPADAARKGMSPAALYAEKSLILYMSRTLGYNAGFMMGDYFHDELIAGAGKVIKGIGKLGDMVGIGNGDSEKLIDSIGSILQLGEMLLINQIVGGVKMLLWPSIDVEQTLEPIVRGYLLESGFLKIGHDKRAYREALMNMTLTRFASLGFITHFDASIFGKAFKQEPTIETIDLICSQLWAYVKHNSANMLAGKVFSEWVVDPLASAAYNHYGPVTPKVMGFFNGGGNLLPAAPAVAGSPVI